MVRPVVFLASLAAPAAAHSSLIKPKPRNAIDSELLEWRDGRAPYTWDPGNDAPCVCRNGTEPCASAQTCLWMSVGCTIGCKECDGGDKGGTNPNGVDRCGSGMVATNNLAQHRTMNRNAEPGSDADWTRFNPWRAPGNAPVYDPCGRAGGSHMPTAGHGEFTDTIYAKLGDLGSKVLPKYPTGTVWEAGSVVETMASFRTNHGGGYQYRLCPLESELTEACFQETPMPFAHDSKLMVSDGTIIELRSVDVSEGTTPAGSTWRMLGTPDTTERRPDGQIGENWGFEPPCIEPGYPNHPPEGLHQSNCSGLWMRNITMYDYLRVPEHLKPGDYVLGFRWDCESSAQIWQSCADVTIMASASNAPLSV